MDNNFIPLESIHIATPCHADWDKMTGDDQTRFCGSCAKNVYNLSAMSREQAQRLILEKEGHLCVQLHRRADGTVITSDCPVGISPAKRSSGVLRTLMSTAVAAILAAFGVHSAQAAKKNTAPRMGRIATPTPTPTPVSPTKSSTPLRMMGKVAMPTPTPKPTAKPSEEPVSIIRGDMDIVPAQPAPTPATQPAPAEPKKTGPSGQSL